MADVTRRYTTLPPRARSPFGLEMGATALERVERNPGRRDGIAVRRTGSTVDEEDLIQIQLFRVRRCPDGKRIYTRIKVTWYYPNTLVA